MTPKVIKMNIKMTLLFRWLIKMCKFYVKSTLDKCVYFVMAVHETYIVQHIIGVRSLDAQFEGK